jgi:hypothetical protein
MSPFAPKPIPSLSRRRWFRFGCLLLVLAFGATVWGVWGLFTFVGMDGFYGLFGILAGALLAIVGGIVLLVSSIEPTGRGWFRFGLGRLFVAVTLCALSFGVMRLAVSFEQTFFIALAIGLGSIVCFAVAGGVLLRKERAVAIVGSLLAAIAWIVFVIWEVLWAYFDP